MSTVRPATVSHPSEHGAEHPHGWRRWLFATNHKDIGTLYLWFSLIMLMIGALLAMLIRLELFHPGLQFFYPELYNQFVTMHGLIMVFGVIMPAFVGYANWMVAVPTGSRYSTGLPPCGAARSPWRRRCCLRSALSGYLPSGGFPA